MTRKFDCHSVASFSPPVVGKVPSKGKEVTRFRQGSFKRFRFKRFKVQTRFRFKRVQVQGSGSKGSRFRFKRVQVQGSGSKDSRFRFKVQVQKGSGSDKVQVQKVQGSDKVQVQKGSGFKVQVQGSGSKGSRFRQGSFKRQRSDKVQTRFLQKVQVQKVQGSDKVQVQKGSGSRFRFKVQVQGSGSKGSRFRQGSFKRQRSEKTIAAFITSQVCLPSN